MSERMTSIYLPNMTGSGISEYGRKTPQEMIEVLRDYAKYQKEQAEIILSAKDIEFRVETYLGVYVRKKVEVLQEGATVVRGLKKET